MDETFDAIVIGSGIGGMCVGAMLAKANKKKVLLLESHWILGGQTHEFRRKNFSWDVGLHYVGDVKAKKSMVSDVFNYITDYALDWNKMPHIYDVFEYPDITMHVPSSESDYKQELIKKFPKEEKAIKQYFKDIQKIGSGYFVRDFIYRSVGSPLKELIKLRNLPSRSMAMQTTKSYMDKHFKNSKLKAILVSQWGDYGLRPKESAFIVHAMLVRHYLHGAYFPQGGGRKVAETIIPVIERAGGKALVNHEVTKIIVENGTAIGVEVLEKKGTKKIKHVFRAPLIISNTGAYSTYIKLLPSDVKIPFRDEIKKQKSGPSAITVYLGLNQDPAKLGFHGENHWIFKSYDHDSATDKQIFDSLLDGTPHGVYLSFPSKKTISPKEHTAEIITFTTYEPFKKWKDTAWMNRGQEYKDLKQTIANTLINMVEKKHPGFKDLITYQEVSTPLTIELFTGRSQGMMYGIPATPERYQLGWLTPKTPIKGLFLNGSDVCALGIAGALMGGFCTASVLNGRFGLFSLVTKMRIEKAKHTNKLS